MKIKDIIRPNLYKVFERKKKSSVKPLHNACRDFGGNPKEFEDFLIKYGDFVSSCVMAKFIERCYNPEFYNLNPEAKQFECVNLFSSIQSDFLIEAEQGEQNE